MPTQNSTSISLFKTDADSNNFPDEIASTFGA